MCPLFLLYLLIAWHVGGRLYRGLYYVDLLRPRSMVLQDVYAFPDTNCFSYRQLLLLWLLNPAIVCHYAVIVSFVTAFVYSSVLIFYIVVCYCIALYLLLSFHVYVWQISKLSIRWSMARRAFYYSRCYVRDIVDRLCPMPHALPSYLLCCFLFSFWKAVLCQSFQLRSITVFLMWSYLRERYTPLSYRLGNTSRSYIGLVIAICKPLMYLF